jgi:RNA polymerase sigma-70 factor, ECF subfamily
MNSEKEFEEWYGKVHSNVLRFVASRLIPPDQAQAEDVTHEAFLVAWRKLDQIPSDPNQALAWILAVARNCLLHSNRNSQRKQSLQVRIAETAKSFIPGPSDGVNQTLDLANAWQKLDPKYQEAIALQVWDGLAPAKAAQVLGITEANYRRRVSRARKSLNSILNQS